MVKLDGSRLLSRPWGLEGGEPGASGSYDLSGVSEMFERGSGTLHAGDIVSIITPGAGGYGLPERRATEARARDRAEGRA